MAKTVEWRHERTSSSEKKRIAKGVKQFFDQNYELRYNTMKQTEEFRPRQHQNLSDKNYKPTNFRQESTNFFQKTTIDCQKTTIADNDGWQQLTDRELRRIAFEQMEKVGVAWSIDIELYVRSALTPDYNPVDDFLRRCGQWDGCGDPIGDYARRVPTSYMAWPDHFHRWFLAMVAQWLNLSRDYGNSVVPMLIGGQGTHKSTFCKLLLPPELREYYIDDIKLDNAEQVERMLGRMLLVNIDEYNAKTDREQAKIKRVLSEKDVQTRKMRSDQYLMLPRMASFIATTNEREPLTDPTGSRRYLCCEVRGIIDTNTPIPYQEMYAQAVDELRKGAVYHFSKEEEAEIVQHNLAYRQENTPEQLLSAYFEPAERQKENYILAVDIQRQLRSLVPGADLPSLKTLTRALKALHFPYGAIGGVRGWYAQRKSSADSTC
ncbi:MAG: hypothetical protein IJ569_03825 [Prevotella sp.]|nr:hypothetical protein [Prevotella sp.]